MKKKTDSVSSPQLSASEQRSLQSERKTLRKLLVTTPGKLEIYERLEDICNELGLKDEASIYKTRACNIRLHQKKRGHSKIAVLADATV